MLQTSNKGQSESNESIGYEDKIYCGKCRCSYAFLSNYIIFWFIFAITTTVAVLDKMEMIGRESDREIVFKNRQNRVKSRTTEKEQHKECMIADYVCLGVVSALLIVMTAAKIKKYLKRNQ